MRRCLELAQNGFKYVKPNPLVGAVIVHNGQIIGEGYHARFGGAHAEVNAIAQVKDTQTLGESTLYVNLEPCCHYGKTPPCSDLIIRSGIKKVVIGTRDTFPEVNGRGIAQLRDAGIDVVEGVLEKESQFLNRRFFVYHQYQRPYIILKWAQSADGYMARQDFSSKWISNDYSRLLVHQWRSEEAAILVGYNTALHDNPQLNSRDMSRHNPVRIVLDRENSLQDSVMLKDGSIPTIVFTQNENVRNDYNLEYIVTSFRPDVLPVVVGRALHDRKIQSVIIEGGSSVLKIFMQAGAWDEARVFTGHEYFEGGISAPDLSSVPAEEYTLVNDKLQVFYNL
jgi:diaminohydroxyphosphoribosylaminopyrimidine deaminase/5-amino-6-(5-phosphoribosylamino)uracil reductase